MADVEKTSASKSVENDSELQFTLLSDEKTFIANISQFYNEEALSDIILVLGVSHQVALFIVRYVEVKKIFSPLILGTMYMLSCVHESLCHYQTTDFRITRKSSLLYSDVHNRLKSSNTQ